MLISSTQHSDSIFLCIVEWSPDESSLSPRRDFYIIIDCFLCSTFHSCDIYFHLFHNWKFVPLSPLLFHFWWCPFKLFITSWFGFGGLNVSRNLSISPRLSNLLAYNCSQYSLTVFCISAILVVTSISFLTLFTWVLSSWWGWPQVCWFCLSQELALGFIDFFLFFNLYLIYFLSDLYHFLPSANFRFWLFFFC